MNRTRKYGLAAAIGGLLIAVGVLAATVASSAASTNVATCSAPSYDGTTFAISCTIPQQPAATETVTQTVTASSTTTAPSSPPPISSPPVTSSPPPPPSQTKNCEPNPHLCGFPDTTNTGPTGSLVAVPGSKTSGPGWSWSGGTVNLSTAGASFCGYAVSGTITIAANNVTVCNTSIVASGEVNGISLRHTTGAKIDHVSITSPAGSGSGRLLVGVKSVYGDDVTPSITNSNIAHTSTGVQIAAGLIENDYIHDMGLNSGDHINGTTSNGPGTGELTIHHNTILNQYGQTDAVSLFEDFGKQSNDAILGNLLAGGDYVIYGGANAGGQHTSNIQIQDNRISTVFFPQGGTYGWLAAVDSGATVSSNVWDASGSPAQ